MGTTMIIVISVILLILGLGIGGLAGWLIRKNIAEKTIGSAETEAKRIVENAIAAGESKKREAIVAAKEEVMQLRNEQEKETLLLPEHNLRHYTVNASSPRSVSPFATTHL